MGLNNLTLGNWSVRRVVRCLVVLILSGVMIAATPIPTKPDFDGPVRYSSHEIQRAIAVYAQRYRLDPALLRAVIKAESGFRQDAVSHKGAIGLMQLMPQTAAALRVTDIHDSLQNIRGGAKQLRHLLNRYDGDVELALAAYNAGVHRVKGGKIPRIRETRSYVRKVLRHYEQYGGSRWCKRLVDGPTCKTSQDVHTIRQGQAEVKKEGMG